MEEKKIMFNQYEVKIMINKAFLKGVNWDANDLDGVEKGTKSCEEVYNDAVIRHSIMENSNDYDHDENGNIISCCGAIVDKDFMICTICKEHV